MFPASYVSSFNVMSCISRVAVVWKFQMRYCFWKVPICVNGGEFRNEISDCVQYVWSLHIHRAYQAQSQECPFSS